MLNKLLKYDLKYMLKKMIIFYILSIFFSFTTKIFFWLPETTFIKVISQISLGCMFSMVGSILFNTVIITWTRFKDSIYKDESYLTHTLPVSKTQIYESRFLQSLIFTIVGFIVIVMSLFITYYTKEFWFFLKDSIKFLSTGLNVNTNLILISLILILFLEIFNIIQSGFLGIIIGHKKNNNKIANSFLYGFIVYIISQFIVLAFVFVISLFDSSIMEIFKSNQSLTGNVILKIMLIVCFIYLTIILLMNIVCCKKLKQGVDVE